MDQHGQRRIEFYDYYFGAPSIHCFVLFPVYQRKFSEGEYSNFQCESCSIGIGVIWADYGVQLKQRFPFAIEKNDPNCRLPVRSVLCKISAMERQAVILESEILTSYHPNQIVEVIDS